MVQVARTLGSPDVAIILSVIIITLRSGDWTLEMLIPRAKPPCRLIQISNRLRLQIFTPVIKNKAYT